MKNQLLQNKISVKESLIHGYGVFAEKDIYPEEMIEECYTLITDDRDKNFKNYYFGADKMSGIPLGFGCIYNHSDDPNATYFYDSKNQIMVFKARRLIRKGEEIFTSYGNTWFEDRPFAKIELSFWLRCRRYFWRMPLRALIVIVVLYSFAYSDLATIMNNVGTFVLAKI